MSSGRYYFPEVVGNDVLSHVAQLSKATLGEGEKIVEIFKKNHNRLNGESRLISLLMKQNTQSIFDESPNSLAISKHQKEGCGRLRKSSEDMSTPIKREASLPRKYLSDDDDTKKEASESETIITRQRRIFSPKNTTETIVEDTDIGGEEFVYATKNIGNLDAENEGNLCFHSTIDEATEADPTLISPNASKMVHNLTAVDQESPLSTESPEMHVSFYVNDCESLISLGALIMPDIFEANINNPGDLGQIIEIPDDNYTDKQDPFEIHQESFQIPTLTANEKHTPSPAKQAKITCDNVGGSEIHVSASLDEKILIAGDSSEDIKMTDVSFRGNYTTKRDSYELFEESLDIPDLATDEKYTPSPVKEAKISCDNVAKSEVQVSSSPDEKVEIAVNPDEYIKTKNASFRDNYAITKNSCELFEDWFDIPDLTTDEKYTPSPVKQAKITFDNAMKSEVQVSASSDETVGIAVNPDGDSKMTCVFFRGNNKNISPIAESKNITKSEEKRKSPCQRRDTLSLRGIPRMICSDGIDELDIELSCESEESPSPKTSRITSRDFRVSKKTETITCENSPAKYSIRSDASDESNIKRVQKTVLGRKCSPSRNESYVYSSQIATETSSPTGDKGYIPRKTISPSNRKSTSMSPKAHKHFLSPLKETYISPKTFLKPKSPQIDVDNTPGNSISASTQMSPKVSKFQLSPSDEKSHNTTPERIARTNNPFEDTGNIPLKMIPTPIKLSKAITSKAHEHRNSPSEKISIRSPCRFFKPESPKTNRNYSPRNSISPSAEISPKITKCQFNLSDKLSYINTPEGATETSSSTGDKGTITRKVSPSTRHSESLILPTTQEHQISPLENISFASPNIVSKQKNPKTNIDDTPRNSISPPAKISPKISNFQSSPSVKMSCINTSEGVTETCGDKGSVIEKKVSPYARHSESLISPKAYKARNTSLEKTISINSNISSKRVSPETNADCTPRKRISPSTKIPQKISKCQFSPVDKKCRINISEGVRETSALTGDKGCITRINISPSTRHSESPISSTVDEHRNTPLEKNISINSPKRESPKANIDSTPRKRISPSTKISPKISKCQFSPSDQKSCINISEGETETNSQTGDTVHISRKNVSPSTRHSESLISPVAHEHRNSPREKISINSPNSSSQPEIPKANIDTPRKRISPSTKISPNISKCQFSPLDKNLCIATSESASRSSSPFKVESYFPSSLLASVSSLKTEASSGSQIDDPDSNELDWFMNKLSKIISMRDDTMNEILKSFSEFQKDLNFLFFYVKKIAHIVEKIPTEMQGHSTEDLRNLTTDLRAKAHKLAEKFNLWKTAGDSEVQVWIQCFEEIRCIKSRNGTGNFTGASREDYISFLQTYEKDLKSVWKKMDDMKIQEDARRASLLNATHEFKMFMKLFIKCLIIIGVLKRRSKTSSK